MRIPSFATTVFLCCVVLLCRGPVRAQCVGDCAGDGAVTVGDIITGVGIALGNEPLDRCPDLDTGHDGVVAINDLVAALNSALTGCVAVR